jgi:hypothetical protein
MADAIDVLKAELTQANQKILRLMKWELLGSQHRADLNDKVGRWVVRYVLVVEYNFCKRRCFFLGGSSDASEAHKG